MLLYTSKNLNNCVFLLAVCPCSWYFNDVIVTPLDPPILVTLLLIAVKMMSSEYKSPSRTCHPNSLPYWELISLALESGDPVCMLIGDPLYELA